jgi:glucosaminylphosphatidylinositol acyltransferase
MTDYRYRKELFVSNLNGTTLFETGCIVINICSTYFLCQIAKSRLASHMIRTHSWMNFLFEYIILIVPMVLVSTCLSSISRIFHIVLWCSAFLVYFLTDDKRISNQVLQHSQTYSRIIELFRSQIFLVTNLCILAVDFPVFPRRYAKTENYGYSGMDLGVGLFALSHGMVSSEARNKTTNWKEFVLENLILFFLGVIRLISIKYFSYVEHVSEYGVHWNFFLTLCLIKTVGNLLLYVTRNLFVLILCVLITHEFILLRLFQYDTYLMSSSNLRTNFIDANREGIFSLGGYISLYLIGILLGRFIIHNEQNQRYQYMSLVCLPMMIMLCLISSNPSRKLCNISYVSSTTGLACMCLGTFSAIQQLLWKQGCSTESILLKNVNHKGLDGFLLANVLTGIINLNIQTIDASSFIAMIILVVYMFIVTGFVYFSPSIVRVVMKFCKLTK